MSHSSPAIPLGSTSPGRISNMAYKLPRASSTNQPPHHPAHTSLLFFRSWCLSPRSFSRFFRARRCSTGTRGGSVLTTACLLPLLRLLPWHIGVASTLHARRRSPWAQRLSLRTDAPGSSISGSSKENGSRSRSRSDLSSGFSFSLITTSLCAGPSSSLFHLRLMNGAVFGSFAVADLTGIPVPASKACWLSLWLCTSRLYDVPCRPSWYSRSKWAHSPSADPYTLSPCARTCAQRWRPSPQRWWRGRSAWDAGCSCWAARVKSRAGLTMSRVAHQTILARP